MNMKKIFAGILACCIIGGVMPTIENMTNNNIITASAEGEAKYTEGTYEQLTYKKYSDYVEISKCDSSSTEVVIPAEIEGLPVTSIGERAFSSCSGLTSVTIPGSVTSIGNVAFLDCSSLTSITIPDSVTRIGYNAFSGTPWLESKQKENPLVIAGKVLIDGTTCSGDVVIPKSVTSIGYSAFKDCSSLTSVMIPESVTSIGDFAFCSCSGLTSVTIPESVTSIGIYAFSACKGLTSVTIPDSVTSIGARVFSDTPWLEAKQKENPLVVVNRILIDGTTCSGDVVISEGVTNIGHEAFYKCSGITSVIIPESVTNIGELAFSSCKGLTSIKIPNSVTNIENAAFCGCICLTSIEIPNNVISIGFEAFFGCSGLTSIKILNPECDICDSVSTILNGNYNDCYYNGIIYGYENSTAQAYAEKYEREFISLGKAPETTTTGKLLLGDANEDGEVNIADAAAIIQHLGNKDKYGLSEQGLINADCCNVGDGVTGLDALALQRLEAKMITKLPDISE